MTTLIPWVLGLLLVPFMQTGANSETRRISAEEREALVALYQATGGPTWTHREGWLGPAGSECEWFGVVCATGARGEPAGKLTVTDLDLNNNGLTGQVPQKLGALKGLKRLMLGRNSVQGLLPDVLLQRFDEARLEIEPLSLIHDVSEVLVDVNNPALLCSRYKARMAADGSVRLERKRCREQGGQQTEKVYCEFQQGRTNQFDRLGRFLVRSGFFAESEPRGANNWQDVPVTTVTAKRSGEARVRRSWSGPISMSEWSLEVALDGVIAHVDWTGPATEGPCSPE